MPVNIYMFNNITTVPLPEPNRVNFAYADRGQFADGTTRRSLYAVVEWRYARLSTADFQKFYTHRPANGRIRFTTFKPPSGAVAGAYVTCTGIMTPPGGTLRDGMDYTDVLVRFAQVIQVA